MYHFNIVNDKNYGYPFPEELPQLNRELFIYRLLRGNHGRDLQSDDEAAGGLNINIDDYEFESCAQHMINAMRILWPKDVVFENRGYVNTNLIEIIEDWCAHDDLGLVGNASSGKTFSVGACVLVDWYCAPECTSTIVGSTQKDAAEDRIWGAVVKLYNCASVQIGELVEYKKIIVFGGFDHDDPSREYLNSIKLIAFEEGNEGIKAVKSTRGRKNTRYRAILDEHAEMGMYVNDIRTNLSANDDLMFWGLANPKSGSNPSRDLCQPSDPRGYEAVNKDMKKWETRTGWCRFLSGERSPNFQVKNKNEKPPFPYLMTYAKLEKILKNCYGNKNSLEYWRNAIGFWPSQDVERTIISKAFLLSKSVVEEPEWYGTDTKVICGFDCGFTAGGDRNAASLFRYGLAKITDAQLPNQLMAGKRMSERSSRFKTKNVMHYMGTKTYDADMGEEFEASIAQKLVDDLIKAGVKPANFGMDVSGDGGKMLQAVIRYWQGIDPTAIDIFAISSMGAATERIVSEQDHRLCCDAYDRRVSEYWFSVYHAIATGCLTGVDPRDPVQSVMIDELCSREFTIKNKKASIETKEDMKDRIRKSPDLADSFVYGIEMGRRAGLLFVTDESLEVVVSKAEYRKAEEMLSGTYRKREEREVEAGYSSTPDADGF